MVHRPLLCDAQASVAHGPLASDAGQISLRASEYAHGSRASDMHTSDDMHQAIQINGV